MDALSDLPATAGHIDPAEALRAYEYRNITGNRHYLGHGRIYWDLRLGLEFKKKKRFEEAAQLPFWMRRLRQEPQQKDKPAKRQGRQNHE